ncbi:FkbM family methyltransferase [Leptolyngbya sp. GB1-A1]|uniref:FkbM family methyltransferase n=1 Tax=Leptolyngbya sp. GB1-A1 TaxID=2933908 RepID=UPI003297BF2C
MDDSPYITTYCDYLQSSGLTAEMNAGSQIAHILEQTQWDEPQTSLDCNNYAVVALIEAENSEDPTTRELYLDMAIAALEQGNDHPLCKAHWILIKSLLGEREEALNAGFSAFLSLLQPVYSSAFNSQDAMPAGLIYLPQVWQGQGEPSSSRLNEMLHLQSSDQQALLLLGEILNQSQLVFYNSIGLRFLHLAATLFPQSASIMHALGISNLVNGRWEGLLYLQRADQQQPNCSSILQSLYLAYKDLQQPQLSLSWLNTAQTAADQNPDSSAWQWAKLEDDSPFTYVTVEKDGLLAVEPSFKSIVTSVLLVQGRWFEQEMEFWRDRIQPGMTVIDVGANVGVYTISAARRVGATGRVVAIEPFSNCVQYLQETCRVNGLDWVTVCRGAASDRDGMIRLALHGASELNEVITTEEELEPGTYEEAPCFSLDTLVEQENLHRVDVLKIDAEGHELQVLKGSDRLLKEMAPVIMYENVAGSQGSNLPVAEYVVSRGYQLFRYMPYLKQLIPVDSHSDLKNSLNIIALPRS